MSASNCNIAIWLSTHYHTALHNAYSYMQVVDRSATHGPETTTHGSFDEGLPKCCTAETFCERSRQRTLTARKGFLPKGILLAIALSLKCSEPKNIPLAGLGGDVVGWGDTAHHTPLHSYSNNPYALYGHDCEHTLGLQRQRASSRTAWCVSGKRY
jgi:hypothetical protein